MHPPHPAPMLPERGSEVKWGPPRPRITPSSLLGALSRPAGMPGLGHSAGSNTVLAGERSSMCPMVPAGAASYARGRKGGISMKRYTGSETVEPGLYFNARQLSFKSVDETGPLPGSRAEVYRRVPILVLLVVGPILGLVYAVFLPFIGFAVVA